MNPARARRERGAALLALLAVIALGGSWYLVSRLNAESGVRSAITKARNAEVLNRAKQALIGYVAAQAANAGEDNPGTLPCPEAAGYFDNPANEGQAASSCTLPKVGRFPWRTIGTEKLVDASGEPLWYVVSPGWAFTSGNTNINSNTPGQLTVDGVANDAVALIVAPGAAFSVPAAAGCTAWNQIRPTTGTPEWRNYLECENATHPTPDATFVTRGPSGSFNDQVVRVTVADIMPGIEAAIAKRIDRDIAPVLKTVFTPATWGFAGSNPVLPFAAPFANPGTGAGTSSYQGAAGSYQGLLPFNQTQGCTVAASNPRCILPPLSKFGNDTQTAGSGSIRTQSTCSWVATDYVCVGEYLQPSISVTVRINAYVAMGLRTTSLPVPWTMSSPVANVTFTAMNDTAGGWGTQTISHTVTTSPLNADGSVTFTIAGGALPDIATAGWGTYALYRVSINNAIFGDHALLNPSDATTGWFVRNEWYRLLYYAVPPSNTALQVAGTRSCATAADCLTVSNATASTDATTPAAFLLLLAGRSVNGSARPSATLADYLESGNATGAFVRQPVNASNAAAQRFNDRVAAFRKN